MAETQLHNVNILLEQYLARFQEDNAQSSAINKKASAVLPGGTSRAVLYNDPFPIALKGGRGPYLVSADGDEYLDLVSEYCAAMIGHSHPDVVAAIHGVADAGFMLSGPTPAEAELAHLLVNRIPSYDAVRFCNSGTEANTMAIAVALAYTARKKVLVFEKGYHGGTLHFSGTNHLNLPHQFVIGQYNDIENTRLLIDDQIGCILVEPMLGAGGMLPGRPEFLQHLRDEATRVGAVLIFDEVITSRLYYGGLQEVRGITPDMTTLGKHFGGGFSFGAFGGRREIMEMFDPKSPRALFHSGTWNNNVFSMTAGVVATKLLTREALARTNALGDKLRAGIADAFSSKRPGLVAMTGYGSAVGIAFKGEDAEGVRKLFYFYLLRKRIYIGARGFIALNITHEEEHIERALGAVREFCEECL